MFLLLPTTVVCMILGSMCVPKPTDCLPGLIFNGKECVPTNSNNTTNCTQMDCTPNSKDTDINDVIEIGDNLQEEKAKIIDHILQQMKHRTYPQLQTTFEKMVKNSIALKGAKGEEKTQVPSQSASNKENVEEIKSTSENPVINDSENGLYANKPSAEDNIQNAASSFFMSNILIMFCVLTAVMFFSLTTTRK